jgi:hypothetical protein
MRSLLVLLVVLSCAVLSGCASGLAPSTAPSRAPSVFPAVTAPATPAASPEPLPIVSIETRGGECSQGACDRLVNIDDNGRIHEVIPKDRVTGTVPKDVLEALQIEMAQANYDLLQSKPFTGECPIAFDGQETIYTFHVPTGDEELASCKVAIDDKHPLFRAVAAALAFETP